MQLNFVLRAEKQREKGKVLTRQKVLTTSWGTEASAYYLAELLGYHPVWVEAVMRGLDEGKSKVEEWVDWVEGGGCFGGQWERLKEICDGPAGIQNFPHRLKAYLDSISPGATTTTTPFLHKYLKLDLSPYLEPNDPRPHALEVKPDGLYLYRKSGESVIPAFDTMIKYSLAGTFCGGHLKYIPVSPFLVEALMAFKARFEGFLKMVNDTVRGLEVSPEGYRVLIERIEDLQWRIKADGRADPTWETLVWTREDFSFRLPFLYRYDEPIVLHPFFPRISLLWRDFYDLIPENMKRRAFYSLAEFLVHVKLIVEERESLLMELRERKYDSLERWSALRRLTKL